MNGIATLTTAALSMTSVEIAELTGKRHDHVVRDIRTMLAELHGEDRVPSFGETVERPNPSGGAPIRSPAFRLPKRETLILVSGYSIEMRARIIDRWQELEAKAAQPFAIPKTLPDALRLAADLADKVDVLETTVAAQTDTIAHQRPAVEFVDRFVNAEGLYGLQNAGRALGLNPNKFVRELKNRGFLFHQGRALVPYERHRSKGIFEVKVTDCNGEARMQTFITPKGLTYFAPLFNAPLQGSLVAAGGVH